MKRLAVALVITMAVGLWAVSPSLAGKMLYADKFATQDPAWGLRSATMQVQDGKFVITPEKNTTQTILNRARVFPNDLEASCSVTFVKAPAPTWGSGLVFWAKGYNEYYVVLINAKGWLAVQRHVGGRYLVPVAWRQTDFIKPGAGIGNQIKVVTKGDQATIWINGQELISFTGQPPKGGGFIGFKAASGPAKENVVAFANLQVAQP